MPEKFTAKSVILYHRSYRTISGSAGMVFWQMCLFVLPVSICSILFYPEITRSLSQLAQFVLEPHYPAAVLYIEEARFLPVLDDFCYLHVPSVLPGFNFSVVNAVVSALLLLLLPRIEKGKPFMIFLIMVSSIHFFSALFFIFFPQHFPYDTTEYSRLYMLQQISIVFFVPLIMGLAVMPLPAPLWSRCLVVWSATLYSLLFGTLRYIVFLYFLDIASLLFMAVLYFITGPLIDFIYITGIYSLFLSRVAKSMKGDPLAWKW